MTADRSLGFIVVAGHGQDGEGLGVDLAGDDPLECHDHLRREQDRVPCLVRVGRVPPHAPDHEVERLAARRRDPLGEEDAARRVTRRDVQGECDVRPAHPRVETIGDHRLRARDPLLGGLADEDEPTVPPAPEGLHAPGDSDQRGHVQVVAAGVHHRNRLAGRTQAAGGGCILQAGLLAGLAQRVTGDAAHVVARQPGGRERLPACRANRALKGAFPRTPGRMLQEKRRTKWSLPALPLPSRSAPPGQ